MKTKFLFQAESLNAKYAINMGISPQDPCEQEVLERWDGSLEESDGEQMLHAGGGIVLRGKVGVVLVGRIAGEALE